MQSFFQAPKDIIGILGERLTDFSTVVDTLESVRNDPETYNKLLENVKAFLTNSSEKYPLKVEYLYGFPNLEVVKVEIEGDESTLMGLAAQPKLRTFNFRFNKLKKMGETYKDAIYDVLQAYCTGTFNVRGKEYTNNRNLRNVDIQIYTGLGILLFILVRNQLYMQLTITSVPLDNLINQYTNINGIWGEYFGPKNNVVYHTTVFPYTGMQINQGFLNLNYNKYKVHISGEEDENLDLRITYYINKFWENLKDFTFPNIVQFDCPIIINSLDDLDETVFYIFPNAKEIMVIPMFNVNEPIAEYKGKILKFYELPQSKNNKLPKLETYQSIYEAMVKESNL